MKPRKVIFALVILASLTGCSADRQPVTENAGVVSIDSAQAENALRESLYDSTGYQFLTQCPDSMSGGEGAVFTCFACPQDYAAPDVDGRYSYGDGSSTWRCDAAGEGFAVDYKVINGQIILENGSTRSAR